MADDVNEGIENALNLIVGTQNEAETWKKNWTNYIWNFKNLFVKLKDSSDGKSIPISELEGRVAKMKQS